MNDPVKEISSVIKDLCAAESPDIQKAALEKYFTSECQYRHPLCFVKKEPGSRDRLGGIYQCYKILSPHIAVEIQDITYDEQKCIMYLRMSETFKLFFLPSIIKPVASEVTTRLRLCKIDGLHYIEEQEDFIHTADTAGLILPYFKPIAIAGLRASTMASNFLAKMAQTLGYWRPMTTTANGDKKTN